jgi:hypothetical protein
MTHGHSHPHGHDHHHAADLGSRGADGPPGTADQPFYLRLMGSDGKRTQVGLGGPGRAAGSDSVLRVPRLSFRSAGRRSPAEL